MTIGPHPSVREKQARERQRELRFEALVHAVLYVGDQIRLGPIDR